MSGHATRRLHWRAVAAGLLLLSGCVAVPQNSGYGYAAPASPAVPYGYAPDYAPAYSPGYYAPPVVGLGFGGGYNADHGHVHYDHDEHHDGGARVDHGWHGDEGHGPGPQTVQHRPLPGAGDRGPPPQAWSRGRSVSAPSHETHDRRNDQPQGH